VTAGLADKAVAIFWRDLLTSFRYRNGFVISAIAALGELAAFYYLARAVGPGYRPQGTDYFLFLLVGTGFFSCFVGTMNAFVRVVQDAQQSGTLEVLMTTSTPGLVVLILSALSTMTNNILQFLFYLAAGLLLFGTSLGSIHVPACVVVLALSAIIAAATGILAAAVQLAFQKGSALVWLFGSSAWLLTGTLFPVEVLPRPVRFLSDLVPLTHCLNAIRPVLLRGASLAVVSPEIEILAVLALALVPLFGGIFTWTLDQARQQGTLSFY